MSDLSSQSGTQSGGSRKAKRQKLDGYLKKSQARRDRMMKKLKKHREERRREGQARAKRAHEDELRAKRHEAAKKKAAVEWRKKEKERKKEIATMMKRKDEEQKRLLAKKEKDKEVLKQKKEYMRTLAWASAMQRLKERRKKDARDAKHNLLHEAEQEHRAEKEGIAKEKASTMRKIETDARRDRHEIDADFKNARKAVEEDVRKQKAKLYAKEQTEFRNVQMKYVRKKNALRTLKDPSMRTRMKAEVDRNEKMELKRVRAKYQQMQTDLEVSLNEQRDTLKRNAYKMRQGITSDARGARSEAQREANQQEMDSAFKLRRERKQAKEVERKILSSTFQEVAEMKEEWEAEAADDDS